jgi:hypothetical protein
MNRENITMTDTTCHHCGKSLQPGTATFYHINVEALADPSAPALAEATAEDLRGQIELILDRLAVTSEEDAQNEVVRRFRFVLCVPCYRLWIDNPTGLAARAPDADRRDRADT